MNFLIRTAPYPYAFIGKLRPGLTVFIRIWPKRGRQTNRSSFCSKYLRVADNGALSTAAQSRPHVRLRIHEIERGEPLLAATFAGQAKPLGTATLAVCLLKFPLMTWKIIAGIHWEALKLWVKGARFRKSPKAPAPASSRDHGKSLQPGE